MRKNVVGWIHISFQYLNEYAVALMKKLLRLPKGIRHIPNFIRKNVISIIWRTIINYYISLHG